MNEGLFKSAINGFKKTEVLHFIDDLDVSHRKKEQELNAKIEELTKQLKEKADEGAKHEGDLQQALNEQAVQKTRVEALEAELRAERGAVGQLQVTLQGRSAEVDGLRGELLAAQQKIKAVSDEGYEKDRQIDDLQNELAGQQETLNKISKTEDQIGRVMLEARSMADKTVEDARRCSEQMLSTAGERVKGIADDLGEFKGKVAGLNDSTREFLLMSQRMLSQIEETAQSIEQELYKMVESETIPEQGDSEAYEDSEVQGDAPFCEAAAAGPSAGYDDQDGADAEADGGQI